jgi:hypothetical protein
MESTPKHLSRDGMARTQQNAHSSRKHTLRISELWSESGKLNAFKCDVPNDRRQLPIKHNPGFVPPARKVKHGKLALDGLRPLERASDLFRSITLWHVRPLYTEFTVAGKQQSL